ncbi:MAG: SEC-C domain-containing protein [Candidatus Rokubacteria bacterium]|nr:SEC-C domain-containing protein [Candidatus Rokubacteria bacterium]
MVDRVKVTVVEWLFKVQLVREPASEAPAAPWPSRASQPARETHPVHATADRPVAARRAGQKVGRNDPCPCGSGKKYKKCCLLKGG